MKKLLSGVFSILLAVSFLFGTAFNASAASSGSCGDSLSWTLNDSGVLTVSGSGRMYDYYDNSPAPWYNERESIKSVVISDGIPNIGSRAFKDCTELESVNWGTIDTIGDHAFMNCSSLKHAFLPNGCTWLWTNAFENCTSLQSAYINYVDSYAAKVPDEFFKGCTSLAVIGLGTGISSLGINAVGGCPVTAFITDNTSLETGDVPKIGWSSLSGDCYKNTGETLRWNFNLADARLYFTGHGDLQYYDKGSEPWVNIIGGVNFVDFSSTDGATSVNTTSFQGRETIERVDFTNIFAIGWGAFAECTNLGSVTFDGCL
ncbi:MAG: leucine-rich repeat domain-containing protein, partial [Eubacterium sp.]|nr:leucine-rich repeat domain-containing protein [Eubacterium sp.]